MIFKTFILGYEKAYRPTLIFLQNKLSLTYFFLNNVFIFIGQSNLTQNYNIFRNSIKENGHVQMVNLKRIAIFKQRLLITCQTRFCLSRFLVMGYLMTFRNLVGAFRISRKMTTSRKFSNMIPNSNCLEAEYEVILIYFYQTLN